MTVRSVKLSAPRAPDTSVPTAAGSSGAAALDVTLFRVSHTTFRPCVIPSHYHERACLTVMLSGSFSEGFSMQTVECAAAGVLAKPAGERHHDVMHGSQQLIVEPNEQAERTWPALRRVFDRISYHRSHVAAAVAARIAAELDTADTFTTLAVEGLTLELVAAILRAPESGSSARPKPPWLERVRARLEDDPRVPTMAELSLLAQVHPAYMARRFREHYFESIGRFARRARLEWAAQQLATTDASVSGIALRAGFADQSHFTRAFRAHNGMPPRRYRLATRTRSP